MKSHRGAIENRLLDHWQLREEFGTPVGCVSTTYTFDGPFFEEECLGRFVGMETDASESVRTYLIEREEKFAEVFAAVLVDRKNVARSRSLRWHQLPVAVPRGRLFHAKVTLLAWTHRIRVLVGSPNLTRMGYRHNYEQIAAFDFSAESETPVSLLDDVLQFLQQLDRFLPEVRPGQKGPVQGLQQFLSRVKAMTRPWQPRTWPARQPRAVLLPLTPGSASIFDQIRDSVWEGTGASSAGVVSPFFDPGDRALGVIKGLVSIMGIQGQRDITFHASGTELLDHSIDLALPDCFRESRLPRVNHRFAWFGPYDIDGNTRPLHAKCLTLERDGSRMFLIGSSNFTAAGTGVDPNCNVEANVAYLVPGADRGFWRSCVKSIPPHQMLDLDRIEARFLKPPEQTPETEIAASLPSWFEQALYEPESERGLLRLSFSKITDFFCIRDEDGETVLSSSSLSRDDRPQTHAVEWLKPRPPSYLLVEWTAGDGDRRESIWVVNVTDTSKLPPPAELRDLSLEMLVEVLTSSRPFYEAVERALGGQERRASRSALAVELDPHRRIDTSGYLLKRVQRVSRALEGLRERLERPVLTLDALRWRLRGPIGAMALARGLVVEREPAAPFLIAEIALMLHQIRWHEAERFLGEQSVREEVASVLRELQALTATGAAAKRLQRYARETFRGIGL